jgi:hypothetical protein
MVLMDFRTDDAWEGLVSVGGRSEPGEFEVEVHEAGVVGGLDFGGGAFVWGVVIERVK